MNHLNLLENISNPFGLSNNEILKIASNELNINQFGTMLKKRKYEEDEINQEQEQEQKKIKTTTSTTSTSIAINEGINFEKRKNGRNL